MHRDLHRTARPRNRAAGARRSWVANVRYGSEADVRSAGAMVRFVPLTDIGSAVIEVSLQGEEKMRRGLVLRLQPLNFRFLTSRQEPCVLRGVPHRSQHPAARRPQ